MDLKRLSGLVFSTILTGGILIGCAGNEESRNFRTDSYPPVKIELGKPQHYLADKNDLYINYGGMIVGGRTFEFDPGMGFGMETHFVGFDTLKSRDYRERKEQLFLIRELTPEHIKIQYIGYDKLD
jgi:hypothetical protein